MKKAAVILLVFACAALGAPAAQSADQKPLPTAHEVLKRVLERAGNDKEYERIFKASYRFTRTKKTVFKNSRGAVKRNKVRTNKNVPQPDDPANPSEAEAKVDESKRPYEESDFPVGEALLARFEYKLVGREMLNGRPAYVIDFAPAKRKLSEKNLKEKFLNKAAGRAWIDEQDYIVAKASIHLTKPVTILGGLVGAVNKFTYHLNQKRTPEGIWFRSSSDWHAEGREVIVDRIIDFTEETKNVVCVKPVEKPLLRPKSIDTAADSRGFAKSTNAPRS